VWTNREKTLAETAGTSGHLRRHHDLPVTGGGGGTAEIMGKRVERIYDVGVAGLHRLLAKSENIQRANVPCLVAGMEGARQGVCRRLVPNGHRRADPASVTARASAHRRLLGMLNSCGSGETGGEMKNCCVVTPQARSCIGEK